jgi:hypothetical protein
LMDERWENPFFFGCLIQKNLLNAEKIY